MTKSPRRTRPGLDPAVLKDPSRLHGVYLLEGEDEYRKLDALHGVRKLALGEEFPDLNHSILHNPSTDDVIAACETLPFLAERRLVEVWDFAPLQKKKTKEAAAKRDDAARLKSYLPQIPGSTLLIFFQRGTGQKLSALYKLLEAQGAVIPFNPLQGEELAGWITGECSAQGVSCSLKTAEMLAFTAGSDTGILHGEICKLAAYLGGRNPLTKEDISAVTTPSTEAQVFHMVDAVVEGQRQRALQIMGGLLLSGERRSMILALLLRQYRLMQHLKIMIYEKQPPEEIRSRLGLPDFLLRRLQQQAGRLSGGRVKAGVNACLDAEYGFKSGRISEESALESVVIKLLS